MYAKNAAGHALLEIDFRHHGEARFIVIADRANHCPPPSEFPFATDPFLVRLIQLIGVIAFEASGQITGAFPRSSILAKVGSDFALRHQR